MLYEGNWFTHLLRFDIVPRKLLAMFLNTVVGEVVLVATVFASAVFASTACRYVCWQH